MRQLDLSGLALPANCGGKANGLVKLVEHGLRVPDSVFIPASMADPLANHTIAEQIEDMSWPLIVRSSAIEEDGQENAFAGLLESIHGVTSIKELVAAVEACRRSGASERVKIYCQNRKIAFPLQVGIVIQPEANPDLAGILFTRDPVFPNHKVAYIEWVAGHGRRLVDGEALDGKAWLDATGRILRTDLLSDTPTEFLSEIADTLKILDADSGRWDLEFFIQDGQLWWVQCRPVTAQPSLNDQATPAVLPWDLPSLPSPAQQAAAKEGGLFEGWDEYNETTVSPLHYDGFYRALWEASLDSVSPPDSLLPAASDFVCCKEAVPIAINVGNPRTARTPLYCDAADLRRLLEEAADRIPRLQQKLPQLPTAKETHQLLLTALELYANLTSVRLRSMWSWIEGIDDCTGIIKRLLKKSDLKEIDPKTLIDELLATVNHETKRMRIALKSLAPVQSDYQQAKDCFLADFGHFQVEGIPYALCSDEVLQKLAASPTIATTDASSDLFMRVLDRLDIQDKERFKQAGVALKEWFELRESSKTQQEIPYLLILNAQTQLARQLEQSGAMPVDSLELHTLTELSTAVRSDKSPMTSEMVARRRSILRWKQTASWIPPWYSGEAIVEQLSPGLASGPVKIVRGLEEFAQVRQGDILVARTTNPAWTPLFAKIAGLIVEHGSRISHAAIVAREYKIPAVAGFAGATQQLVDGELVEVDGNKGEVRRLNKSD